MTDTALGLCHRLAASSFSVVAELAQQAAEGAAKAVAGEDVPQFEPFELLGRAARGDLVAQRELAALGIGLACSEDEPDPMATLAEALTFARMAAAHGDHDDQFRCCMALAVAAMLSLGDDPHGYGPEAIGRLELLADEGDERAGNLLASYAGEETPEVLQAAGEYRDRLRAVAAMGAK